jgi:hypothetical protein
MEVTINIVPGAPESNHAAGGPARRQV